MKEIKKRLKNAAHDGMFYYNYGIAVANIMKEDNIDGFNAALSGMFYFESLIGLNKSNWIYLWYNWFVISLIK